MSYINNIKIARLEHTNASTYGGPFLASTITGLTGIYNNLNVYGTISANSLYFTSTTAIELTVTGQELNFLGSLSITGDNVQPIKDYLFTVYDNNGINKFIVTTGGYVGINNIAPEVELHIEGGQIISGTTGSNFIMLNGLDRALKFDTTLNNYEFFNLNNFSTSLGIYPNKANVLSITGASVISSSAIIGGPVGINTVEPRADLHVDGDVIFDNASGILFKLNNNTDTLVKFDTTNEKYEFSEWGGLYKRFGIYPTGTNILSVTGAVKISGSASLGGPVGINTLEPKADLHVDGNIIFDASSGTQLKLQNTTDTLVKFDTSNEKYEFNEWSTLYKRLGIYPTGLNVLSVTGAAKISGSAFIGGQVGINTLEPRADLHVDGNVIFDASSGTQFKLQNQTDSLVKFDTANEAYEFIKWNTLHKKFGIYPAGINILSVTGAIKISSSATFGSPIGINTVEPRADLHVDGNVIFDASSGSQFKLQNATDTLINFDAANEIYEFAKWSTGQKKLGIYPNGVTTLSITGTTYTSGSAIIMGVVGINTPEPLESLHVNGNVIFDEASGIQFKLQNATDTLVKFDTANEKYTFYDWNSGALKLAIYPNQDEVLSVSGNVNVTGDLNVNGFKNFRIDHPNPKKNETHYLVHSALEGPEAGIYYRINVKAERFTSEIKVNFPDYWKFLIEDNKTQIFLSSNGYRLNEYIKNIYLNEYFIIKKRFFQKTDLNCIIFSSRKSEKKFKSEILKKEI